MITRARLLGLAPLQARVQSQERKPERMTCSAPGRLNNNRRKRPLVIQPATFPIKLLHHLIQIQDQRRRQSVMIARDIAIQRVSNAARPN